MYGNERLKGIFFSFISKEKHCHFNKQEAKRMTSATTIVTKGRK